MSGAISEGWWCVFPPCAGVELPPCPPRDKWGLLRSKTMRLRWLGNPSFLALSPELCRALVWDREPVGAWCGRRKLLVAIKAQSFSLPREAEAPFVHSAHFGLSRPLPRAHGDIGPPFLAVDTCHSDRARRAAGQGQTVRTREAKRRKRGLERKGRKEGSLHSQATSAPSFVGKLSGMPFLSLHHGPEQMNPLYLNPALAPIAWA